MRLLPLVWVRAMSAGLQFRSVILTGSVCRKRRSPNVAKLKTTRDSTAQHQEAHQRRDTNEPPNACAVRLTVSEFCSCIGSGFAGCLCHIRRLAGYGKEQREFLE